MKFRQKAFFALIFVLTLCCTAIPASADTAPKPSVRVSFVGLADEECYATLLSESESTGPASAWDGTEEGAFYGDMDYEIWRAFVEYEDTDGFFYLQQCWRVDDTKELAWTYYPPGTFKILLYFPQSDSFAVSGIYERYAFDSYFTAEITSGATGGENEIAIEVSRSYDYTSELLSLAARIVITIILETALALLFGYRTKEQLVLIGCVNAVTQIVLNVLLNIINYRSGSLAFVLSYIGFELLVFAIEAIAFSVWLTPASSEKRHRRARAVVYAFVANALSFGAGFAIAWLIPGIF